jgi:hypothetical protein
MPDSSSSSSAVGTLLAEPVVLPPVEEIRRTALTVVSEEGTIAAVLSFMTYDGEIYVWQDVDATSLASMLQAILDELAPYVEP